MKRITNFQIGKLGITEGVIESLELSLKHHKQIKISVLKASGRNRENMETIASELVSKLKEKKIDCDHRIIGFTISLIKSSNSPREKKTP